VTRAGFILLLSVTLAPACTNAPTAPTIVPPFSVASVPTARPGEWDSRSELAAWVGNGVSTGTATVIGDGTDAVIRIDLESGPAVLHGPDLDPPWTELTAARVRYRWTGGTPNDVLFVDIALRPPTLPPNLDPPKLFYIQGDLSKPPENRSGEWVNELLTGHGLSTPPYNVRFATLTVSGSGVYAPAAIHGIVEIDSIALVR
jgi:hypothetical protein